MPSFAIDFLSTTQRTLAIDETGLVGANGVLNVAATNAVFMSGVAPAWWWRAEFKG